MKMLFFLGRGARWSRSRRSKRRWLKPQLKMPQLKHPQRARKSQNTDAGFSTNAHCQARIARLLLEESNSKAKLLKLQEESASPRLKAGRVKVKLERK